MRKIAGEVMPGIFDKINRFLVGDEDKISQASTATQGQQDYLNQLLSQLQQMNAPGGTYAQSQDYLSRLLNNDPQTYANFAAPYKQNFEQQTVPRLAERFAGLTGAFGNPGQSSGFGQAIGGAGAQLDAQLAGLFANLQQNAAGQAMNQYNNMSNLGLGTRQFENVYQPASYGLLGDIGAGLGQGFGMGFGMPAAAGLASKMGNWFGGSKKPNSGAQWNQGY